jgi:hypothetical protein
MSVTLLVMGCRTEAVAPLVAYAFPLKLRLGAYYRPNSQEPLVGLLKEADNL